MYTYICILYVRVYTQIYNMGITALANYYIFTNTKTKATIKSRFVNTSKTGAYQKS